MIDTINNGTSKPAYRSLGFCIVSGCPRCAGGWNKDHRAAWKPVFADEGDKAAAALPPARIGQQNDLGPDATIEKLDFEKT